MRANLVATVHTHQHNYTHSHTQCMTKTITIKNSIYRVFSFVLFLCFRFSQLRVEIVRIYLHERLADYTQRFVPTPPHPYLFLPSVSSFHYCFCTLLSAYLFLLSFRFYVCTLSISISFYLLR